MELRELYGGSFVNWEAVAESWARRTLASRALLFAARRYLEASAASPDAGRGAVIDPAPLPEEIKAAFSSPPEPGAPQADLWGRFIDAAVAAELETVSYGERPPILYELRVGLSRAASEAGPETPLEAWFLTRRNALPGPDLPDDPGYVPV